jgi:predicted amidohydrolase
LNLVIVGGFCERLPGDELANSAAMIDANGLRAVYRKAHLWDAEKDIFTPGDAPPVVETLHGRLGMLICYDLEFPEWVRLPALAGPAEQGGEQMLLATLNLAEARNKRISARNDLHRDRRPQLYG